LRIAFDATSMPANRAGAGRLMFELGHALARQLGEDELLLLDRYGAFRDVARARGVTAWQMRAGGRVLRVGWEQGVLPAVVRRWGADIVHGLHHSLPVVPAAPVCVVTVHDVTFDLLPRRYSAPRRWYMRSITRLGLFRADRVIVPSAWVLDALVRRYRIPPERIHVIHEAPAAGLVRVEDRARLTLVRDTYGLPPRFLLSVGTREPGKNRAVLQEALARLRRRNLSLPLVVVGGHGWGEADRDDEGAAVLYTGYVSDEHLAALYSLAEALLFPSWLEGFGLPPLEAMACGTPVISSNRPAMTDILGDAATYADPSRPEEWAEQIERLVLDGTRWEEMRRRGLERAARYSWERAARETLEVYRLALQE
jgi:glycosyltransferase involved in cell wall biosynthesis